MKNIIVIYFNADLNDNVDIYTTSLPFFLLPNLFLLKKVLFSFIHFHLNLQNKGVSSVCFIFISTASGISLSTKSYGHSGFVFSASRKILFYKACSLERSLKIK